MNNTLMKNQWVTEVIRDEIKKFLESNENENTTYQNLWDRAKVKFIAISAYIKKKPETSQINNLMMHFKLLEKQEQTKPQTSRQREIIKFRDEIKTKQTLQRINETKSWFF
jgi:hypothetical protein